MITKPRHIDLHLPQSWNQCTTAELEAIAAAIISEQLRVGRYHIFDWSRVKLDVVLAVNEITVMEDGSGFMVQGSWFHQPSAISPQTSDIESTWLVQRPEDKEPWAISAGQLVALTERLAWIDDEKADRTVFMFPYPELTLVHGSRFFAEQSGRAERMVHGSKRKAHSQKPFLRPDGSKRPKAERTINREPLTVAGPPPLLDGYTWREYRILTDWMQEYMRCANVLAQVKSEKGKVKNQQALDTAQREFLAILFKPSEGSMFNVQCSMFNDFSPVQWQVILFWWSSLMGMLAKKFPRVFKSQPVGKKQRPQKADTPWDFYNRVTATIQKYIGGLSSQDVDNQPYGVTLQQLEMMADEAAEMEKLKAKK